MVATFTSTRWRRPPEIPSPQNARAARERIERHPPSSAGSPKRGRGAGPPCRSGGHGFGGDTTTAFGPGSVTAEGEAPEAGTGSCAPPVAPAGTEDPSP